MSSASSSFKIAMHSMKFTGTHSFQVFECVPVLILQFFTGWMLFLTPNQQRQSTESTSTEENEKVKH